MNSQITRQQIEDWLENPVTLVFKTVIEGRRQEMQDTIGEDCYHPFEPQRTQEILAQLSGSLEAWDTVIAALEGEGLFDED